MEWLRAFGYLKAAALVNLKAETGAGSFPYPAIMQPLEPFRDHTVILSGLWSKSAEPPPGQDRSRPLGRRSLPVRRKAQKDHRRGCLRRHDDRPSFIAQKIGQETLLPSLQLALEDPGANSSNCGEGYSCTYSNTISWSSPTQPLPMELDPQVAFERLFGSGARRKSAPARRQQRSSILDSVTKSMGRFKKDLGPGDKARLEEYETDIRRDRAQDWISPRNHPENWTSATSRFPRACPRLSYEHVKLHFDLQVLAFQADITRVSTVLYARDLTARTYPESGSNTPFHGASHHAENPRNIENYSKINQYHVKCLAYFVDKLKKSKDGDGSLLDHSLILYGTNMGDSNQHLHYDVPHILVGGASASSSKGNRHLALTRPRPRPRATCY
jgi:hypothetical protein